jgi:hypothetical protein
VTGFGHQPAAITILGRATPVLNHGPVCPRILMPRRLPFSESLVDLSRGLLGEFGATHAHFDRAVDLGLDRVQPRVNIRRNRRRHSIPAISRRGGIAHHSQHVLFRRHIHVRRGTRCLDRY